jgi:hypothetical protein
MLESRLELLNFGRKESEFIVKPLSNKLLDARRISYLIIKLCVFAPASMPPLCRLDIMRSGVNQLFIGVLSCMLSI